MALWTQIKYAKFLAHQLERWTVKKEHPFEANFRCGICGDSQKNKSKARGYIYTKDAELKYKCHNCGVSMSFSFFLKRVAPNLFEEYKRETYFESDRKKPPTPPEHKKKNKAEKPMFIKKTVVEETYMSIAELPKDHPAKMYCDNRQIPLRGQQRLVYVDDIDNLCQAMGMYVKKKIYNCVGIPFHRRDGTLSGITCRSLDPNDKMRYMTVKFDDEFKFFGAHLVKTSKDIYVVEGAFDSLFLDNCMAVGDATLTRAQAVFNTDQLVLIYDNQPRNAEIVKLMLNAWSKGFRVVVWPDTVPEKDINEMVMAGRDVKKLIVENIYKDAALRLRIGSWKRVSL